jgi:bifunctional non-homologous end joining protein LigD
VTGGAQPENLHGFMPPMLAVAGRLPPRDGAIWAYELKWDGQRAITAIGSGTLRLWARSGRDITRAYPELQQMPVARPAAPVLLDGEIVALTGDGWPSFEALQQRMHVSSQAQAARLAAQVPVTFLAFDVLWLDGRPLLDEPYSRRREVLEQLGYSGAYWQTPPSFTDATGEELLAVSRQHGLEGIMAKRLASRYEPGRRSQSWIKIKNVNRQEAVVGGWQPGEGGRAGGIGSLLVGIPGPAGLEYAGHVGTGFTRQALAMLQRHLAPLRRDTSPFAGVLPRERARSALWAEPRLVIDVEFAAWTRSGVMRAASYKGLRTDKDPAEVVREP